MGEIRIVGQSKTRGYPYPVSNNKVNPIIWYSVMELRCERGWGIRESAEYK